MSHQSTINHPIPLFDIFTYEHICISDGHAIEVRQKFNSLLNAAALNAHHHTSYTPTSGLSFPPNDQSKQRAQLLFALLFFFLFVVVAVRFVFAIATASVPMPVIDLIPPFYHSIYFSFPLCGIALYQKKKR